MMCAGFLAEAARTASTTASQMNAASALSV
jgi:hypothetical protein